MKRSAELLEHSQMYEEPSLHGRQPARSSGSSEASQPSSWTPTRGKKNTSVLRPRLPRTLETARCQLEAAAVVEDLHEKSKNKEKVLLQISFTNTCWDFF